MVSTNPVSMVEELLTPESKPWITDVQALAAAVQDYAVHPDDVLDIVKCAIDALDAKWEARYSQLVKLIEDLPKILAALPTPQITVTVPESQPPHVNIGVSERVVDKEIAYDEQNRPVRVKELRKFEIKEEKVDNG